MERLFVPALVNRSRFAMFLVKVPKWLYQTPLSRWMKSHALLLTTTGRRSGNPHQVALDYWDVDGQIYILSGWKGDTDWCKNLRADPLVEVQIGVELSGRRAVELTDPDKEPILDHLRNKMPNMVEYLDPEDPVFRLEPV